MSILHHLAQAAAVLLLVELLVVLLLFLAVAGGLAFGLHWVRGKSDWAFDKANGYLPLVTKYSRLGTDLVAKPFIVGGGTATLVRVTLNSIARQVRANRVRTTPVSPPPEVASRPVVPEETMAVPVFSDETIVTPAVVETTVRT